MKYREGIRAGVSRRALPRKGLDNLKTAHYTALTLAIIGAINWGLWGVFQFDLVAAICGGPSATLSRLVYSLVGLAGLALAFTTATHHSAVPQIKSVATPSRV